MTAVGLGGGLKALREGLEAGRGGGLAIARAEKLSGDSFVGVAGEVVGVPPSALNSSVAARRGGDDHLSGLLPRSSSSKGDSEGGVDEGVGGMAEVGGAGFLCINDSVAGDMDRGELAGSGGGDLCGASNYTKLVLMTVLLTYFG